MKILLTNDDGITSRGLFAAKLALDEIAEVAVIAPDSNRSAIGRAITITRSLTITEVELRDGSIGYATDGTPVDCVRFADLGLVGERPDLIVSGINYGVNLGDDVTYSGTVAAAFEGIVLGIPGIAISQQSVDQKVDFKRRELYDFDPGRGFCEAWWNRSQAVACRHARFSTSTSLRRRSRASRWGGWAVESTATDWSSSQTPRAAAATASTAMTLPTTTRRAPTSRRSRVA